MANSQQINSLIPEPLLKVVSEVDVYSVPTIGLTSTTATGRQEAEGFNEIPLSRPKKLFHFFAEVAREPMVYLLVACGFIYLLLGDRQEAIMLLGFLAIIIGITVYQESKAEHALEALRDLSSPRALVLRDGEQKRIPGREVVREDIVFINEGDRIPADATIVSGLNVATDESLLTGESVPVDKSVGTSLFSGSTVVRGQAIAQVKAIGTHTEIGKIGKSIQSSPQEPTRLEAQTRKLVWKLTWVAVSLCILVVIVFGFTRHNWLSGFLSGLSLAMAILPNELPAVLTIFLALGAWRMSRQRVLTRKMPAIENLGSVTVLCVDKTGTLTANQMSIQQLYCAENTLSILGLEQNHLPENFHEVLEYGILASRKDPFDPMDKAFQAAGKKFFIGTEHVHPDWDLKKEYPLSPELLSISNAWKSEKLGEYVIGAKGAPEAIIDLCHLNSTESSKISKKAAEMAANGLRILGVAKAKVGSEIPLPHIQHDFDFEFFGLVGLADPIRPEVPQAIAECQSAGVRVVMITGDHPNTARSIASQIGLTNPGEVLTGSELALMPAAELRNMVRKVSVFSRTTPDQKLKLVNALKENGEIVAMTGDGVNDAPALKSANIGIAMGLRGSDVARESADIVLLDDDFSSIVEAIRMGRRVYKNLQKAFSYLLAAHIPIAGISVLPVLLKLPLVLFPVHISFLQLIIAPACSVAYETEPASPNLMKVSPRSPTESLFSKKVFVPSLVQGLSVLTALILIFAIALHRGQGEFDARALTFTTLTISNLMLIIASQKKWYKNKTVAWIIATASLLLGCVLYIPYLRELFRFSYLHPIDLALCLGVGMFSVLGSKILSVHPRHIDLNRERS